MIGGLICEPVQNSMSSRIWWMNNRTMNCWSRTHLKRSESPQRWHGGPSTQLWMREPCIQKEIRSEISVWINGRHGTVKKHWIGRAQKLSMLSSSSPRNRLYEFLSNVWLVCIGGDPLCRSMRSPLPPLIVVSLLCVLALGFVRDTLVLMDLGKHCAEH